MTVINVKKHGLKRKGDNKKIKPKGKRIMAFKEQNPETWNDLIKGFGYICPECGNRELFQQFWHIIKDITQDPNSGRITSLRTNHDTMERVAPIIIDVQCVECGCSVNICKKGICLDILEHEEYELMKASPCKK